MINEKIEIISFNEVHQNGIDRMMSTIGKEFPEPIISSKSKKIKDVAILPQNKYWVALCDSNIVGTVGLTTLSNNSISLKSMFLASEFRGLGLGKLLLDTIIEWCFQNQYSNIYLGTMSQFKGGQIFYVKNKFKLIDKSELPADFPINVLDTIFYWKKLDLTSEIER